MITKDLLKQSNALSALTDEQLEAIVEIAKNDFKTEIDQSTGRLHGRYDSDIETITGVKRGADERSFDFLKRVLTDYKTKTDGNSKTEEELKSAKEEIQKLNAKIAEGAADKEVAKQLKDAQNRVAELQTALESEKASIEKQKSEYENTIKGIHVDHAFNEVTNGLKFKASIPESIRPTLIAAAKAEVLAKGTPDFVDNNGVKTLVFRDANNNVLNNPKTNLNPYTVSELIGESAALKDAIDNGKVTPGGGTKPAGGSIAGGAGNISVDISGCKSQTEVTDLIERQLLSEGLTRDSLAFSDKFEQIFSESGASSLPIRD
jgi:hypothetical protein